MKILAFAHIGSMSGGANRSLLMVIRELTIRYGYQFLVVVPEEGELTRSLSSIGVEWEIIAYPVAGVVCRNEPKDVFRIVKANLIALKDKQIALRSYRRFMGKFDAVYVNTLNALVGYYFAQKLHLPIIWHLRGALTNRHYYVINQRRILNDKNGKVIAISNSLQNDISKIMRVDCKEISVIHNGLELNNQLPSSQSFEDGIQCLITARITPSKGQLDAILAVSSLRRKGYNVFLTVAGSPPGGENDKYYLLLKKACQAQNMEQYCTFIGQVDNMPYVREKMNIELVCSECEPFGRSTVEAMQSRLVVIAANTGGTLDIINNKKNGYLYKQGDVVDLANTIQYVIDHSEESISVADYGYEFAKTHFTMDENVEKMNQLFNTFIQYRDH